MKCLRCKTKEISGNKTLCAACLAKVPRATPRWAIHQAPLKIGFFAGDEHAPPEMREANERPDADLSVNESCILLDWAEAFTVLRRTQKEWEEFHPDDYDWQVNGWLMEKAGVNPLKLAPLTPDELKDGNYWPKLPANPTTADFAAEVLIQYYNAIDRMSYENIVKRMKAAGYHYAKMEAMEATKMEAAARNAHETLYLPLTAALDRWTDTAMEQMPLPQGKSYRIDQRLLYKAAYEVHYLGGTKTSPMQEAADLGDTTLLDFALTHDLVPGARKIVPKNWSGGQSE